MQEQDYPNIYVREVNGVLVLEGAIEQITDSNKLDCIETLKANFERIYYFLQRMKERNDSAENIVIMIINADDAHGKYVVKGFMPGYNWQEFRDRGEVPYARGLVLRQPVQASLALIDTGAGIDLKNLLRDIGIVVIDHGTAIVCALQKA